MIYRRHKGERIWHFCRNCPAWPDRAYEERTIEPAREMLCTDCTARNDQLNCEVVPEPGSA